MNESIVGTHDDPTAIESRRYLAHRPSRVQYRAVFPCLRVNDQYVTLDGSSQHSMVIRAGDHASNAGVPPSELNGLAVVSGMPECAVGTAEHGGHAFVRKIWRQDCEKVDRLADLGDQCLSARWCPANQSSIASGGDDIFGTMDKAELRHRALVRVDRAD